jgi:hypothetical protein
MSLVQKIQSFFCDLGLLSNEAAHFVERAKRRSTDASRPLVDG